MKELSKTKFNAILTLTCLSVILLVGIFVNELFFTPAQANIYDEAVIEPSLSHRSALGTADDDYLVDVIDRGDEQFVFFNTTTCGVMLAQSKNEQLAIEGFIKRAVSVNDGFCLQIEKNGIPALQTVSTKGVPIAFKSFAKTDDLQYLGYRDGQIIACIKEQGEVDTSFTVYKFDSSFNCVYERVFYTVYDISLVDFFELSNKSVLFFNARYGSVQKGGFAVIYPVSKGVDITYFQVGEDHLSIDVTPFDSGFLALCASLNGSPFFVKINEDCTCERVDASLPDFRPLALFSNGKSHYFSVKTDTGCALFGFDNDFETKKVDFVEGNILDCTYANGVAVFCVSQRGGVYLYHTLTSMSCLICSSPQQQVILRQRAKLSFYYCDELKNPLSLGKTDVFYGCLL